MWVARRNGQELLLAGQGFPHASRRPSDLYSFCGDLNGRLLAFERHHEHAATPFEWKLTRKGLTALMDRLSDRPGYPERLAA